MSHWTRIASIADCPPGGSLECVAGDHIIALFNVAGEFFAIDGVCPHQGGPLGKGALDGAVVTCPWHGWQFDVREGRNQINPSIQQSAFPVRVEGQEIWVDLG